MKVIILAGGFATRLWPLTEKTAKPLVPLAGKPLISWIIESLPENLEIFVSTNAVFANDFQEWKKKYFPKRKIEIFIEDSKSEKRKKGALYATSLVIQEKKIQEDILVIAGDNYFGFSFDQFFVEFQSFAEDVLLAVYDIEDAQKASFFGVVVPHKSAKGVIQSFQEKPEHPKSTLVATGCFVLPQKNIKDLISFSEKNRDDLGKIFEYLLEEKHVVRYFSFQEEWFDIGSFSAYLAANLHLLEGKIVQGKNTSIAPNTSLRGSVFLGDNVMVRENVSLENSLILEGVTLDNCSIQNAVIGKNTFISGVDISHKILRDESFVMSEALNSLAS